jgi:hypothetical protein
MNDPKRDLELTFPERESWGRACVVLKEHGLLEYIEGGRVESVRKETMYWIRVFRHGQTIDAVRMSFYEAALVACAAAQRIRA